MNTSAKLYAVTFLAASALGVAVLTGGCTVTSGTVNDTDGGSSGSSGTSGTSGSSGTTDDGGTEAGPTCNNPSQTEKFSATCQACLEAKCCNELNACYTIPKPGDGTKLDCNDLTKCITDCRANNPPQNGDSGAADTCADDCADPDANADGVVDAYNAIIACTGNNCNAECE